MKKRSGTKLSWQGYRSVTEKAGETSSALIRWQLSGIPVESYQTETEKTQDTSPRDEHK